MNLPISLIISYSIFSIFLFYQQLYLKNFRGESTIFGLVLGVFVLCSMLFGIGCLIYWGYKVSWFEAAILLGIAFIIKSLWFFIEAKLGLEKFYWYIGLAGFIILPVSGYFIWVALP